VNIMTTVRSKLLPLSAAALLATLCGPVSADYNMNTTIQDGRINTNDTYQRGPANDNATWQEGRDNANRTRQGGRENWNATAQFGRVNYNETHQDRRFKRTKDDRRGRGGDRRR
jgi:minor curlin subunit